MAGFSLIGGKLKIKVSARKQAAVPVRVQVSNGVKLGAHILTADVHSQGIALREWSEAIVTVTE